MASIQPVYELKCSCNSYPWGKQGSKSLSAQLCSKQPGWDDPSGGTSPNAGFKIDESKSYAEMWMGTYPTLPSYLASTGENLQDLLDKHPEELVGGSTIVKFGHSNLPFLPKVLSIAKALPLQLHPNKDLATLLHDRDPQSFTDPNHKPEIALALSEFEAFCGFKPLATIDRLMRLEPLKAYMPAITKPDFDDQQLKGVVKKMLNADDNSVRQTYKALVSIPMEQLGEDQQHIPRLAPRLAEQYSEADPGLLVALVLMNYVVLQPGEALYIPADGIHAYLSGDIIECMARSNNVLNVGFCPRAERNNVDLFTSCLTYSPHSVEESLLPSKPYERAREGKTVVYCPPLSEFDMLQTELKGGQRETLEAIEGPGILLATKGSARMKAKNEEYDLKEGHVFFVAPGVELELDSRDGLLLHMAFVH